MRRNAVLKVPVTTLFLFLASGLIARGAPAEPPYPIRIACQPTANWLRSTARELKLFEKAGLAPTYVPFDTGAPMIAAAQETSIDVADVGIVPFMLGLSKGIDWVLIGISGEGAYAEGIAARRDRGIDWLPDLKGKRIGYARGSTAHYGLIMTLRQQGIGLDQVTLVDMPPVEQLAALENGSIDAAISWEPWLHRMTHEAGARVIATEGDLGIYTNVTGYAVRREWLSANRETAVRFIRALLMAYDVLKKDRDVGIKALAKEMGIKETWVKEIYDDAPPPNMNWWKDRRDRYSLVEGAGLHRRLGYLATFLLEEKLFPQPVDVSEVMDVSIITEVLGTLKSQPPTAPAQ